MRKIIFLTLFLFVCSSTFSQKLSLPIGTWQTYFDYSKAKSVVVAGSKVYCANQNGFYLYNNTNKEATQLTDENGFNDKLVSILAFHEPSKTLIVTYENGNIDLAKLDANFEPIKIKNIASILYSNAIIGLKKFNQIEFNDNIAYLSTDFGLLQIDLVKLEIKELAQNIGVNGEQVKINSSTFISNQIYASSTKYLLKAEISNNINLKNFENWQTIKFPQFNLFENDTISKVINFNGKIFLALSNNGFYELTNGIWKKNFNFTKTLKDLQVLNGSIFLLLNDGIYISKDALIFTKISEKLISKPFQISLDLKGNYWIADNNNGLLSNIEGEYKKFNPRNSVENIFVRNDSSVIDQTGYVWTRLARNQGLKIKNTAGKEVRFSIIPLNANDNTRVSNTVNSLAVDKNNLIIVGTDKGIVGIPSIPDLFLISELNKVIFTFFNSEGVRTLKDEIVTTIAIDGGNRKWVGTANGLYLFEPELSQKLAIFLPSNSPIPVKEIDFIKIDPTSGEVFVYTEKGIVSYRADASESADTQGDSVLVFPNPVRPEFNGLLGISGLVANAFVKITDVSGRLVYQTRANGGTATWNILAQNGQRAESGVYFVFSANEIGDETLISKFVVIK